MLAPPEAADAAKVPLPPLLPMSCDGLHTGACPYLPLQENFVAMTAKFVDERARFHFLRLLATPSTDAAALTERFQTAGA